MIPKFRVWDKNNEKNARLEKIRFNKSTWRR